ncbi:metallopeptidase, zinc binding protein [Ketogulonicigenium robustum]|uniref:Metallopeptidase, zinc binding protein n=1 Tax=Ketogulonicigenium robustum TaxID=92947 RepID=A0A1W6NYP6_9RHOB|nr:neutral zinc metallopeptidase [Ketogulonicigenium robustum]ARO14365.1 metallopeptidase, zinc binding protein [Ketogulonicigenium robustum]
MKWQGRRQSSNIDDRRGRGGGRGLVIGGGGGLGVLAIVVIGYFMGIDLTPLLDDSAGRQPQTQGQLSAQDEAAGDFVAVTLADTEEVWTDIFRDQLNAHYQPTTLVLFSGMTQSACGGASAATGPFYCPNDKKVYLDTDFFNVLSQQMGAEGDFAAAYVVAHEVGHYVQDQLGILSQANSLRAQSTEAQSNAISVMIELQADCFAGVWANVAQDKIGAIERGDFAEAMNAAGQIGDDTLQRRAGQAVRPDNFTHGTSAERQHWFETGLETGRVDSCDTFSDATL